jgi:DNA-binding MarR family transcriptional regulator
MPTRHHDSRSCLKRKVRVYTRSMATQCYCIALRKASRRLTARYDEAMAPFGISIAQFSTLRNIHHNAPISLTELGRRQELDRSTVGRNIRGLERMGLVAAETGDDQREALLSLTDAGRALLAEAMPVWTGVQAGIEERLGSAVARDLNLLLDSI